MNKLLPSFAGISALMLLFLPLSAWAAQDLNRDYLPLSSAELGRRFPLTYAGTLGLRRGGAAPDAEGKQLPERVSIGAAGATVSHTDDAGLAISGKDKGGKEWHVSLGSMAYAYAGRFYVADLDRNGLSDLIIVFPTGGNGLAPSRHLFTLTFDERGRPVPFEADGYFGETEAGIYELVDMDRDGRAELIYMNYDDGYWITSLYEVRDARWQRASGLHGRRRYPLYTRFTNRPNRKAVQPKRGRHPFAPDLSNSRPVLEGRLLSFEWAKVSSSEDIRLTIETRRGEKVESRPVSWYASFAIVLDKPLGRRIITLSADEEAFKAALEEIAGRGYDVALYGQRRSEASTPEIMWARPRT